jgi:hypothetical protein
VRVGAPSISVHVRLASQVWRTGSWFFDSQGGYGGGDWERDGNTWTTSCSGVLPEGQIASSTNSMKFVDDNNFLFRSVDRDIDGLPLADVEAKFVRKAASK